MPEEDHYMVYTTSTGCKPGFVRAQVNRNDVIVLTFEYDSNIMNFRTFQWVYVSILRALREAKERKL